MSTEKTSIEKATTALMFVELGLTLLEKFLPLLSKEPTVTIEQQKEVMRRVSAIRSPDAFSGPEWEAPPPPAP